MLAHNIKDILTRVPEAIDMVKKADLEKDFPVDSADSAAASYLRVMYLEKVASRKVDLDTKELVTKAASLYGIKDRLDPFKERFASLEKKAQEAYEFGSTLKELEAGFEGDLGGYGFLGLEKAAAAAEAIVSQFGDQVTSEAVKRYSGRAWLNKEAAVQALTSRYMTTKEVNFVKVARVVVNSIKEDDFDAIRSLCGTVTQLDKKAGLDLIGFDFYKEALITKESAFASVMNVNLAGTSVPWESIQKFGKDRIASTIGADIAKAMTGNIVADKAMLESLPRDNQIMLAKLVKGC